MAAVIAVLAIGVIGAPANARAEAGGQVFRWAFQGDAQSLEPYGVNETFTLGFLGNVYEGLVRRDPDLRLEPALAERWEILDDGTWRFHLRRGVRFHDGSAFDADDVIFSAERVRADGSDLKNRIPKGTRITKVDSHTVDFTPPEPTPILHAEWATWYILDSDWARAVGAVEPAGLDESTESHVATHANGTGPFRVVERQAGVRTVLEVNHAWWDTPIHNLERVEFTPIGADSTRVAALLSGAVDLIFPVPVQDLRRVDENPAGTRALVGPELRTIFLGMNQSSASIASVDGDNPLRDKRVRAALYMAVDADLIREKVMRGLSRPTPLMISPTLLGDAPPLTRLAHDPEGARALLAEAGFPNGFRVGLDCPNDRYVNDAEICQAVASMLARVGVRVDVSATPKAQFFQQVFAPRYDTDFYLLGWTPGSFDAWNVLHNLLACRNAGDSAGRFNIGGYCNPEVDRLTRAVHTEFDRGRRDAMIRRAFEIAADDIAYLPLHQQSLAWGVGPGVTVEQRADNQLLLYRVRLDR